MEFSELPYITSNLFYLHANPNVLEYRTSPSCLVALLLLEKDDIIEQCTSAVQPYEADPSILVLAPGQLILQFIATYMLECFGEQLETHNGCALCTVRLPCHCMQIILKLLTVSLSQDSTSLSRIQST
jgi:hypothetical protein